MYSSRVSPLYGFKSLEPASNCPSSLSEHSSYPISVQWDVMKALYSIVGQEYPIH